MDDETPQLIACFSSKVIFDAALDKLREAQMDVYETYSPVPPDALSASSTMPLVALIAGFGGTAAAFLMQLYANTLAYPLDIGGRPEFSWPSFIPIAFETGILLAVVSTIFSVFIQARLMRLYAPIDGCRFMNRALSDRWIISITGKPARMPQAIALCEALGADQIEEFPDAEAFSAPVGAAVDRL